jgi:hypothetical protein
MSFAGNLTLAIVGGSAIGAVFVTVILSVRRVERPRRVRPLRPVKAIAVVGRPELPAPPQKELTR